MPQRRHADAVQKTESRVKSKSNPTSKSKAKSKCDPTTHAHFSLSLPGCHYRACPDTSCIYRKMTAEERENISGVKALMFWRRKREKSTVRIVTRYLEKGPTEAFVKSIRSLV